MENRKPQNDDDEETQEPLVSSASQPTVKKMNSNRVRDKSTPSTNNDICSELMGDWGKWQFRTVSIVYLTKIPAAWFMACLIFTAPTPWIEDYQCDLSQYENGTDFSITHPDVIIANGSTQPDYCQIILATNESETVKICDTFVYNIDPYINLVTQFDLFCTRNILIAITQCFHLFGVLIGGIAANELMVFFRPKIVMMAGMILLLPCGITTGLAPWFWLHVALRCLSAACCALIFTPGGVIMMDTTAGRAKTIVAANFEQFWSIGVILLTLIGYFTINWFQIYVCITTPIILVILLWKWIPDSPRWHLEKNNIETVQSILEDAVKVNGSKKTIPDNLYEILQTEVKILSVRNREDMSKNNWSHLFTLPNSVWMVILLCSSWGLILTAYYGTLLNIRSFGREYLFYTTPIAGLCELIGGFIGFMILLHFKNKWKIIGIFTFLTGVINFTIWACPTHVDGSHMLMDLMLISMVNKIGINSYLCLLLTCTAEIFPLPHKKRIVYACTVFGRIIFLTAPLIGVTAKFGDAVSLSAFGLLTSLSGVCAFFIKPIKSHTKQTIENIFTINIQSIQNK